jgi:hypothetical protein
MANLVFKLDNNEIRVGQDVRAEYKISDTAHLIVVLTNEGVIMDWYDNEVCVHTWSQTFEELSADLEPNDDYVE